MLAGQRERRAVNLEVFVINLDRRPDRMDAMTKMLNGLKIKFERVSAIDGRSFNVWQHTNSLKTVFYHDLRMPTAGTIACYLSHRQVWEEIVSRNLHQAIIFEDDVIPVNFDPAILDVDLGQTGLDQLRLEEWDRTDPGRIFTKPFSFPLLGRQAMGTPSAGTGSYIVTLQGAEKLLRAGKFWFTVDHFDIWERVYGLRTAVLRPKMFHQADPISDIESYGPPNELLPTILKEFIVGPRPTFAAGIIRLLRWVKGAGVDIWANIRYALGYPFKKALFFYVVRKGENSGPG
jgi:glycosyl transferase family 25